MSKICRKERLERKIRERKRNRGDRTCIVLGCRPYHYLDSKQDIEECLACKREECVNCKAHKTAGERSSGNSLDDQILEAYPYCNSYYQLMDVLCVYKNTLVSHMKKLGLPGPSQLTQDQRTAIVDQMKWRITL